MIRPTNLLLVLLVLLSAAAAAQLWFGLASAPAVLATSFGAGGAAQGWMAASTHASLSVALWVLAVLCFWVLPAGLRFIPTARINLPRKDHWLAPERAAQTWTAVRLRAEAYGLATLCLMLVVHALLFRANAVTPPTLDEGPFLLAIGVYLVGTVAFAVVLLRRFARPQAT